jgi:hypothetical protein
LASKKEARDTVRAGLCQRPEDWRWSSVTAHLKGRDDVLVRKANRSFLVSPARPNAGQKCERAALVEGEPNVSAFRFVEPLNGVNGTARRFSAPIPQEGRALARLAILNRG